MISHREASIDKMIRTNTHLVFKHTSNGLTFYDIVAIRYSGYIVDDQNPASYGIIHDYITTFSYVESLSVIITNLLKKTAGLAHSYSPLSSSVRVLMIYSGMLCAYGLLPLKYPLTPRIVVYDQQAIVYLQGQRFY